VMAAHLPRFGVDFVVLDPPELREALGRLAERVAASARAV